MVQTGGHSEFRDIAESFYSLAEAWADEAANGALPVESVYREWTEDPAVRVPFARSAGHFGSDSALHMSSVLEALGIEPEQLGNLQPDHLAVELNVAGILAEMAPSALSQFVEDRLDWLDDLESAGAETPSRLELIDATRRCIRAVAR